MTNETLKRANQLDSEIKLLSAVRSLISEGKFVLEFVPKDNDIESLWNKVYLGLNYQQILSPLVEKCEEKILETFDVEIEKKIKKFNEL